MNIASPDAPREFFSPEPPPPPPLEMDIIDDSPSTRKRGRSSSICSTCNQVGHNSNNLRFHPRTPPSPDQPPTPSCYKDLYIASLERERLLQEQVIDLQGKLLRALEGKLAAGPSSTPYLDAVLAPSTLKTITKPISIKTPVTSGLTKSVRKTVPAKPDPVYELRVTSSSSLTREQLRTHCSELIRASGLAQIKILSCRLARESIIFKFCSPDDRQKLSVLFTEKGLTASEVLPLDPEVAIIIPNDCLSLSDDQLLLELCSKNNLISDDVKLLKRTSSHLFIRTPHAIYRKLTSEPAYMNFGRIRCFLSLRVKRCYACHRIGHVASECSEKPRCGRCSSEDHPTQECTAKTPKCPLCDGPHDISEASRCPKLQAAQNYRRQRMHL